MARVDMLSGTAVVNINKRSEAPFTIICVTSMSITSNPSPAATYLPLLLHPPPKLFSMINQKTMQILLPAQLQKLFQELPEPILSIVPLI